MDSCGSGTPLIILQVNLALSPSCGGSLGPNNSISGRTAEKRQTIMQHWDKDTLNL